MNNKIFQSIIFLILVGCLTGCMSGAGSSAFIGKPAPPYTPFFMLDAEPVVLESLRGKNVAVLFWAATCNQSQVVVDELNEYLRVHGKQKNLIGIAVSIDTREDLPKLRERIAWGKLTTIRHSYSGNDIYDQAKLAFDVDTLPSLFLIDTTGKVVAGGTSIRTITSALGD